jgi:hypothetical protein
VVRTECWLTLYGASVEINKMLKGAFSMLIVSDTPDFPVVSGGA